MGIWRDGNSQTQGPDRSGLDPEKQGDREMTIAEQIAEKLGGDGQVFRAYVTDDTYQTLDSLSSDAGARCDWRDGFATDVYRYTYPDGSIITVAGDAWDFGYPDCFCWPEAGHHPNLCRFGSDYQNLPDLLDLDHALQNNDQSLAQVVADKYNVMIETVDVERYGIWVKDRWLTTDEIQELVAEYT
jgi:hypothetical protein